MNNKSFLFSKAILYTALLFIALIIIYGSISPILSYVIPSQKLRFLQESINFIQHIILVLSAVTGVHLLENIFLWKKINQTIQNYLNDKLNSYNKEIKESLNKELQAKLEIVKTASDIKLESIYPNRQFASKDILGAVEKAKGRVWLMGISFTADITLNDVIDRIKTNEIDFKILLLDIYRSPAIYRAFIESPITLVKDIVDTEQIKQTNIDSLRDLNMFQNFYKTKAALKRNNVSEKNIRFYGHLPTCWMVIADYQIFYQPYTFGRGETSEIIKPGIGSLMPVFKFIAESGSNISNILIDHYLKIWLTTTLDIFHIESRTNNENEILETILKNRRPWFKHISQILNHISTKNIFEFKDKRNYSRQIYDYTPNIFVKVKHDQFENTADYNVKLFDFSKGGICLESLKELPFNDPDNINLEFEKHDCKGMEYILSQIYESCENNFQVRWKKRRKGKYYLGLQTCRKSNYS